MKGENPMYTDKQKEQRRHDRAAESMFRITNWLLGRDNNNFHTFDNGATDILEEALASKDKFKLAVVLDHLRRCDLFETHATEFEAAIYDHLQRDIGTVWKSGEREDWRPAEEWFDEKQEEYDRFLGAE
jgi:hypothetical protein